MVAEIVADGGGEAVDMDPLPVEVAIAVISALVAAGSGPSFSWLRT